MRTSRINIQTVRSSSFRIDPSYHLSDAVLLSEKLHSLPYPLVAIKEVVDKVFYGNIFTRIYVKDAKYGVPYLAASDTVLSNIDTGVYLSRKQASLLNHLFLKKDWILITCSGTIGNVTYTTKEFENKIATHDLIRIIPNDNKILRGFLYAYLASKYGKIQLTQSSFGAVIKHINIDHISAISVPQFDSSFQKKVDALVRDSAKLRDEAKMALIEATSYFNKRFPIGAQTTRFFSKSIHSLYSNWASFNNNLEVAAFVNLYSHNSFKIKEKTTKVFAPPMFKHIYLSKDNGYPFMTGGELSGYNIRYYRWLSPRGVGTISDYVINKGTLLLYKSGSLDGMIGSTYLVDDTQVGCCLSDHVIRVVFDDLKLSYWTFAFLKSEGGIRMLKSLATGSAIPFITPERIEEVCVPNPDENYEKVTSLIAKYIELISRSKQKDNHAISMVEAEIEKWNN